MTRQSFGLLDVVQQDELVDTYGLFVRTQLIKEYLCDIYLYDNFYVVFFYPINQSGLIRSSCINNLDYLEVFINSIDQSES